MKQKKKTDWVQDRLFKFPVQAKKKKERRNIQKKPFKPLILTTKKNIEKNKNNARRVICPLASCCKINGIFIHTTPTNTHTNKM